MKICEISVRGLFGRFDHTLALKLEENITIMHGPNGSGKTMVLRLVDGLFNQPIVRLRHMPFGELRICFIDGSQLAAIRLGVEEDGSNDHNRNIVIEYVGNDGEKDSWETSHALSAEDIPFPVAAIDDLIPILDRVGAYEWRDRRSGERFDLSEVLERFGDELPLDTSVAAGLPEWLGTIRESVPVRYIGTERLTDPIGERRPSRRVQRAKKHAETNRTVRRYSEEMGINIQETLTEYGTASQSLDRTFPARIVEEPVRSDLSMEQLRSELGEIERRRMQLVEAGLLAGEQESWTMPLLGNVDESRKDVLAVYARDAKEKLKIFDDVFAKVDAFRRIANSRFLRKKVTLGRDGFGVETSDGEPLELEMLSSGEQHELVFLYDLLFKVQNGSLILFDEPELSLHLAWQEALLTDLQEIAKLSDIHLLLATHSAQIIGDRWDLTVELNTPENR